MSYYDDVIEPRLSRGLPYAGRYNNNHKEVVKKMSYVIYADGACSNNQTPEKRIGGWAFVVLRRVNGQPEKAESSGCVPGATNNQMELRSVIEALKFIVAHDTSKPDVVIHSDSQYFVSAIDKKWLDLWKTNGWRTGSSREPVKNQDLWVELSDLLSKVDFKLEKVVGDGSVKWNDYCDVLARKASGSKPKRK